MTHNDMESAQALPLYYGTVPKGITIKLGLSPDNATRNMRRQTATQTMGKLCFAMCELASSFMVHFCLLKLLLPIGGDEGRESTIRALINP